MGHGMMGRAVVSFVGLVVGLAGAASVAVAQEYDIDWVSFGYGGNPASRDPWGGLVDGRGSVAYEYRMGRYEITTGQWMEFVNTFSTQSDDMALFGEPFTWGATIDWSYDGPGFLWKLSNGIEHAEMVPVHGISWRLAAMYANWRHNGMSSDLSAIEDGAYDTSTFTTNGGIFNDQLTHHPDARYWIPSLDEWVKAAHYDPDRYGNGQGGWWDYADGSDDPLYPGFPGEGETSATLDWDGAYLPLGSYTDAQSPWGLFDVSGGTMEWTEEATSDRRFRWLDGAPVFHPADFLLIDRVDQMADGRPEAGGIVHGLRLASTVPAPSWTGILAMAGGFALTRRRRSRWNGGVAREQSHPAKCDWMWALG